MKKEYVLVFIFSISCLWLHGQNFTIQEFIGNWKVDSIIVINDIPIEHKRGFEIIKAGFLKSKFIFKGNRDFILVIPLRELEIKNTVWKYDPMNNLISIYQLDSKENKVIMELFLQRQGEEITLLWVAAPTYSLILKKEK